MSTGNTAQSAHNATGRSPFAVRRPSARSRMTNGTRGAVLPGIDQRSAVARRFRDVIASVCADLGGADRCTETRLQLIRRFAALAVQAEAMEATFAEGREIDISAHAHISSTLVRLAARIGLKRVPKNVTPDLRSYLDGGRDAT
jgi:hypothetical protein